CGDLGGWALDLGASKLGFYWEMGRESPLGWFRLSAGRWDPARPGRDPRAARWGSSPGYIRSGAGMPSSPRPATSTHRTRAHNASLLSRTSAGAFSTGHSS